MNKIFLIISREYLSRVKKKSFIVMTFLVPILMAAFFGVVIWLGKMEDEKVKKIAVVDKYGEFKDAFKNTDNMHFDYLIGTPLDSIKKDFSKKEYYAVLYNAGSKNTIDSICLSSDKQVNFTVKMYISNILEKKIEREKLTAKGIDANVLNEIKTDVSLLTIKWGEEGKEQETSPELLMGIGMLTAFLIYMFIFMYGSMVMRGVIEEKTNRIVEVIISSVRPFQLMMGKIAGIAFVALTQFILWIVLTLIIVGVIQVAFIGEAKEMMQGMQNLEQMNASGTALKIGSFMSLLSSINFPLIISCFFFYFIGGYLLYASLFAAIGSAVDNETETQQFMLPITLPLIIAFVMVQTIVQNPDLPVSFWMSVIPFTSPIVMMVRLPFGDVSTLELVLSMVILIVSFVGTTWLAAKIYRVGILMYGKKSSYKELWKWIRYKS